MQIIEQEYIDTGVEVEADKDSDDNTYYTLKYDGCISSLSLYMKPTKEFLLCFKSGILAERDRIWDESEEVADDKTIKKLLRME